MKKLLNQQADIVHNISAKNIKESNLALRHFYDELSKNIKIGWNYMPYRIGNVIYIGKSSFGDMWIDYREKGKINNIYVSTSNTELHDIVKNALDNVTKNRMVLKEYDIEVSFCSKDIAFSKMCKNNIEITSKLDEDGNYITTIGFTVKAFGDFDLDYVITQKMNYLKHLLCVYTNFQFEFINEYSIVTDKKYVENDWNAYDLEWMDYFWGESGDIQKAELIPDFFDLFSIILDNDSYEKIMRLLLNSAQEIYCAKMMIDDTLNNAKYVIPGYVDLINTMIVSGLEPLSNIGAKKAEQCPICGNLKYKIRSKIKDLCLKYFEEEIVKVIFDIEYNKRSAFLHEGNARTNEFYSGRSIPLINPNTGNSMLNPVASVNITLFDHVTYVFRQKVHEILNDENIILM